MSCAPFCTREKSEGRYKDNSTPTILLDRSISPNTPSYLELCCMYCLPVHELELNMNGYTFRGSNR